VKVSPVSLVDGAGEAPGFFFGSFLVTLSLGRARDFGFGFGAGGEVTTAIVGFGTKGSSSGADVLLSVCGQGIVWISSLLSPIEKRS
jgi:hypothetical protein